MNKNIKHIILSLLSLSFIAVSCDDIEVDNPNAFDPDKIEDADFERRALDLVVGGISALQLPGSIGYDYTSGAAWLSEAATVPDQEPFVNSWRMTLGEYDTSDPYVISIYRDTYTIISRANVALEEIDKLISRRIKNLQKIRAQEIKDGVAEEDLTIPSSIDLVSISDFSFSNIDSNSITDFPLEVRETLFGTNLGRLRIYRGQALFLRALGLFWATNTFNMGNVVMPLSVPKTVDDTKIELSKREDVFAQIVKDLKLASNLYLSGLTTLPDELTGLATWGAAKSLLGKVYLYNEQFEESAEELKKVIECGSCGYQLLSDNLEDNFNESGEFNAESIFEVGYLLNRPLFNGFGSGEGNRTAESTRRGLLFAPRFGGGSGWLKPSHFITNLYKNEVRTVADKLETEEVEVRSKVRVINNSGKEVDVAVDTKLNGVTRLLSKRAKASLFFEDDNTEAYSSNTRESFQGFLGKFTFSSTRSWIKKFTNYELGGEPPTSGINERVIRFADVKLMYAEALVRQKNPNTTEAVVHINDVRAARGLVDLETLFKADNITPPVAELYATELDDVYGPIIEAENISRIEKGAANFGPNGIMPFKLEELKAKILNDELNLVDDEETVKLQKIVIEELLEAGKNATMNLDWNRSSGTSSSVIATENFPENLLIEEKDINNPDDIVDHLFNKERPAEFAFEGHGITYNDLRRRPGGAVKRLEELSQYEYISITPDATLGDGQVANAFQASANVVGNIERYYQDFVTRVNTIRGSRLRGNLYLPIPLIALEENDKLLEKPELLVRD